MENKDHYAKKFFEVCRYINDNFIVEETLWNDNTIVFKIHNIKYVAVKILKDDPNNIYCYAAHNDIVAGPLSIPAGGEPILSFNDLKKYIKRLEKNIGLVDCPVCRTTFIPD